MTFQDFLKHLPHIEQVVLPGEASHFKMAPPERVAIMKNLKLEHKNPKKAAVMMLFYPKNNEPYLILIERNSYPGVHSSQIAFPGGKVEISDLSLEVTALRETQEEIGVNTKLIHVIRPFTPVYIPPSNFLVYPFLGVCNDNLIFNKNTREVASIIEIPITHLLNDKIVINKKMDTSYSTNIEVPAFQLNEHYVWGATAMMLNEIKEMLKKIL